MTVIGKTQLRRLASAPSRKDTGGWGFEGFTGDSTTERAVGANAKSACVDCHTSQKARDYVFSSYRK